MPACMRTEFDACTPKNYYDYDDIISILGMEVTPSGDTQSQHGKNLITSSRDFDSQTYHIINRGLLFSAFNIGISIEFLLESYRNLL